MNNKINKKFTEININDKLYGSNYKIYKWEETDNELHIYVKALKVENVCPECGCVTTSTHCTYERKIQDIPHNMKTTFVHVNQYKYNCLNPNCKTKVIMGKLDFASPSQSKTNDLICVILAVSAFMSNEGASKVLGLLGIKVSNDTINRLYNKIKIEDNVDITSIGVDDVAIRKGQKYATAIYDMADHHLIALLDGREKENFAEWLKNHIRITKVTRDRASAYAQAISEIIPNCIQIADRFHLLQNLDEALKEVLYKEIPNEIVIQGGQVVDNPKKEYRLAELSSKDKKKLAELNYDNTAPVDENGEIIEFDDTIADKSSKQYKEQLERKKKENN